MSVSIGIRISISQPSSMTIQNIASGVSQLRARRTSHNSKMLAMSSMQVGICRYAMHHSRHGGKDTQVMIALHISGSVLGGLFVFLTARPVLGSSSAVSY